MDGYALRNDDTMGASRSKPAKLKITAEIPAGSNPNLIIGSGETARIFTGAVLPAGEFQKKRGITVYLRSILSADRGAVKVIPLNDDYFR